jgi:membrane-associated protease RseP (regulator of RpoE activity)
MSLPELEILNSIIGRVFRIDDYTAGGHADPYLMRYRGQLSLDSVEAYDQLCERLRPYDLTPLFRIDELGRQVILLVNSLPKPRQSNSWVNVLLFVLTVFSVMLMGVDVQETPPPDTWGLILFLVRNILSGWPFALSLLSILLAHEFGHYLAARYHKTAATLPYFIPLPFSILGTLGAVIVWKELPRNKRILFDVGVAGPLAGLFLAIPILLYGLSISKVGPISATPGAFLEGNSLLYLMAKYAVFGKLLPEPASYGSLNPLLYWLRFFFTGTPLPLGGTDVTISSVALAGWAGILVTALNLLPAGQLDGGHVMYVLFGRKLKKIFPYLVGLLVLLGFFWSGWWLWVALLFTFGRQTAEPLDQITEIDAPRRALAWLVIFIFFLVFMPVPMILY